MAEPKIGEAFIKHEFDEAIAIQQALVDATSQLIAAHPDALSRTLLEAGAPADEAALATLRRLGERHGATGAREEVAGSVAELLETTAAAAGTAPSEAYEAHAVILSAKRKQGDAAAAMRHIARDLGDVELHGIALAMEQRQKVDAALLADALAGYAVTLASQATDPAAERGVGNPAKTATASRRRAATGKPA